MSKPIEVSVSTINQTCGSFPSQWEAVAADGRNLYIRYRHGTLELWASFEPGGDPIFADSVAELDALGDYLYRHDEGTMTTAQMMANTAHHVRWVM